MRLRSFAAWLAALWVLTIWAAPAAAADEQRPEVGLALAGGGAKGIAHIGVLLELERLGVPVDYVAGTSMGSIIGGLYASGFRADELAETVRGIDWSDTLNDRPRRRSLSFRRKQDDERYLLDLELGLRRGKLLVPPSLQTGQKLTLLLQWLTRDVRDVSDFDELPIPFRCVATDIRTGEEIVLGSGDLAQAMRASMAIPSVFAPVEWQGRTLVDGGIVNNVPVDVVRSMGADVVIAIDLGAPLASRDVDGLFQVYQQMIRMLTRKNMEPRLADADLVLRPPGVSEYGTLDFSAVDEILELGRQAVRDSEAEILALLGARVGEAALPVDAAHAPSAGTATDGAGVEVAGVEVVGNQRVDARILRSMVRLRPRDEMDYLRLTRDVERIYGLGDFESVALDLRPLADAGSGGAGPERIDVRLRVREKSWGPTYVRAGLFLRSDLDDEFTIAALSNVTFTRLNALGAEWRNEVRIGRRQGLHSEFYQPLDWRGRWFAAPEIVFDRRQGALFLGGSEAAEIDERRASVRTSVGYQLSSSAEIRLGLEVGRTRIRQETGRLLLADVEADTGGLRLLARLDRVDDASFPSRGARGFLDTYWSMDRLRAEAEYGRIELRYGQFTPRGRTRVFWALEAGGQLGSDELPAWDLLRLGGLGSLSGYQADELRGRYKGVLRLGGYRDTAGGLFVGAWLEFGNVWQERSDVGFDESISTGTVFVARDTLIGPIFLAYGRAESRQDEFYLGIGRIF